MSVTPNECARRLLDAAPAVMRDIRTEMRRHRAPDMSVSQFRVLAFLNLHDGAALSEVAEHTGLTLPSVSRMLDGLVSRRWVTRGEDSGDRRRLTLSLTQKGEVLLESARAATQDALAKRLENLSARERVAVAQAMDLLQRLFAAGSETHSKSRRAR